MYYTVYNKILTVPNSMQHKNVDVKKNYVGRNVSRIVTYTI